MCASGYKNSKEIITFKIMSKMFHLDCEEEDYAMNGFIS